MTLWPRTLFVRTVMLFSGLLLLSYLAAIILFFIFFTKPIAISTATFLSKQIISMRTATKQMSPEQQRHYLSALQKQGLIELQTVHANTDAPGRKAANGFQQRIADALQQRLGGIRPIRFQFTAEKRVIWLKTAVGNKEQWLGVSLSQEHRPFPISFLAQLVVIMLLTLVGAMWIAFRLNKPFRQLTCAAAQLGQGESPAPLKPSGPKELRALTETFNRMARDVNKLAEDRNLLLAGVSHDLRTPLSRMRLAVEMLDKNVESDLYNGMVQDLEDMDRIIGQFLAYIREGVDEPLQSGNLNLLIKDITKNYARQDKPLTLNLGELPDSRFKPVAMKRLLTNLIDNAWHYGQPPVEIHSCLEAENILLCVIDHGSGIPIEDIERLKQPFTRLHSARSSGLRAGLGLAIVQRIAREHHGTVHFTNPQGGGLEVCLALPRES